MWEKVPNLPRVSLNIHNEAKRSTAHSSKHAKERSVRSEALHTPLLCMFRLSNAHKGDTIIPFHSISLILFLSLSLSLKLSDREMPHFAYLRIACRTDNLLNARRDARVSLCGCLFICLYRYLLSSPTTSETDPHPFSLPVALELENLLQRNDLLFLTYLT